MASKAGVILSTTSAYTITATSAVSAVETLHLHLAPLPDARACFAATDPGKGRRRIARATLRTRLQRRAGWDWE